MRAAQNHSLQYEKHMTHHMPRGIDLSWVSEAKHVFLIRSPARVIASYRQKMPSVTEDDIGMFASESFTMRYPQYWASGQLFWTARMCSQTPRVLRKLCEVLGVPWIDGAMTQWPAGTRSATVCGHRTGMVWSRRRQVSQRPRPKHLCWTQSTKRWHRACRALRGYGGIQAGLNGERGSRNRIAQRSKHAAPSFKRTATVHHLEIVEQGNITRLPVQIHRVSIGGVDSIGQIFLPHWAVVSKAESRSLSSAATVQPAAAATS